MRNNYIYTYMYKYTDPYDLYIIIKEKVKNKEMNNFIGALRLI